MKWQNRAPSELLAAGGDVGKLGFSAADLAAPLMRYEGGAYTVRDFFDDLMSATTLERPPQQDDPALRVFLEDRATFRLLLREARARGLGREPDLARQSRDREASYLVNRLYEQVVVRGAALTPEERERLRAESGRMKGIPPELAAAMGDPEVRFLAQKRRQVLHDLLNRLRRTHPPQVNEEALAGVPWPVPPKENA
jgi:hypothetical protein